MFYLIASAIVLTCVAWLAVPLLKKTAESAPSRELQNIAFAKKRLLEIQQQKDSGTISEQEFVELEKELEDSLISDLDERAEGPAQTVSAAPKILVIALLILLPSVSAGLYWFTGTPQALQQTTSENVDVAQMLVQLEQRLQQNPNEIRGWEVAARTYLALGNIDKALAAHQRLLELYPAQDPRRIDSFAALADMLAVANQGSFTAQASDYLQQVLNANPKHPQGLWLAGLEAIQNGERDKAIAYWQALLPMLDSSPQQQQQLRDIIAQAGDGAVFAETPVKANAIHYEVTVNEAVLSKLRASGSSESAQIFVFARDAVNPGPPLAAKRYSVKELPVRDTLTTANAMLPNRTIADADQIEVIARLSLRGIPTPSDDDIESTIEKLSQAQTLDDNFLQLSIE